MSPTIARMPPEVSTADKRLGALAHLGIPIYSVFLPWVLYAASSARPFRRRHARHSIPFQCGFLALWIVVLALAVSGATSWVVPPIVLVVAFVLEMPNAVRALNAKLPLSFLP